MSHTENHGHTENMVQFNNDCHHADEQLSLIQPDVPVIGSTTVGSAASNNNYEWAMNGAREYAANGEFSKPEGERHVLMNGEVQLPTPPRSENSSSLSVSPRGEAAVQSFAYDGPFLTGASHPNFAECGLPQNGVFDYGASDFSAQYAEYGAPADYIMYQPSVAFPEQYGGSGAVDCTQPHSEPLGCTQQPLTTGKRAPLADSASQLAAEALLSKHVPVTNGTCTYVMRIRSSDVGRFIGAWGTRIRNLQWQTHTTVTVRCATAAAQAAPAPADTQPSTAEVGKLQNDEGATNGFKPEATACAGAGTDAPSIPVEVHGFCSCVMHALREIYFRFPLSDFGPIDVPNIVKRELKARASARATMHQHASNNGQTHAAQQPSPTGVNGTSKESSGVPTADKAAGNTNGVAKQKRRKKALAKRAAAAQQEVPDRASPNGQLNSENSWQQTAPESADARLSNGTTQNGSASHKDRKPLLFSEFVMQKVAENGTSAKATTANNSQQRNRAETNGTKQQPAAARLGKKKPNGIDIESMKDFPPLAGAPTTNGSADVSRDQAGARAPSAYGAPAEQNAASDLVDGDLVEQTARELGSLTVTNGSETRAATHSNSAPNASANQNGEWNAKASQAPLPTENGGYVPPLGPDSVQFAPVPAYAYNPGAYGYYPLDYAAYHCPGYYPSGSPNDYYANATGQPYMAYMQHNGAYSGPVQYPGDGPLPGVYAGAPPPATMTPGWTPDASAFVPGAPLAYPAVNQFVHTPPYGVPPCDNYEPPRAYDATCAYQLEQGAAQWSTYADRPAPDMQSQPATGVCSSLPADSHTGNAEPASVAVAQPTGILLPCRVSAVSTPGGADESDALDVHVQLLTQTDSGLTNRSNAFIDSLTNFYNDAANLATHRCSSVAELAVSTLFAVRLGDAKWHRAELLSLSEDQLRVLLVDVGSTLDLPFSADGVAQLAETFKLACVAPLAIRCRVRSTRSLRTGMALSASDAFALLSDGAQRPSPLGAYVRLSARDEATSMGTSPANDADLFVDD